MYLLSNARRFIISERTFCIHNIEFSCAAASAKTTASMDQSSIDRHNLRRQLQRFVMTTIRVMAWPVRVKRTAHGEKRLLAKAFLYQTASCVATSTNTLQPNLRASNSGELPPRHHVGQQLQQCYDYDPRDGVACTY